MDLLPAFVAFDFDGTLTDFVAADRVAIDLVRRSVDPAIDAATFHAASVEEIMKFHADVESGSTDPVRMHPTRLVALGRRFGIEESRAEDMVSIYRHQLIRGCVPVAGATGLLRDLAADGVRLAVVTNAYDGDEQRARIAHCFPDVAFDAIVVGGECTSPKPSRAPFDVLLGLLGEQADTGVYVGDQPKYDVPGAHAVGLRTIIVSGSQETRQAAEAMGAESVRQLGRLRILV